MKKLADSLIGFIFLGMTIVAFIVGLIILSYILIYGAIVGIVLYAFFKLKEKFFPTQKIQKRSTEKPIGRIIDHDPENDDGRKK